MTNYNERLEDLLAAVYLAGTENGLSRRLTDAEEIMHRKKAFINGNHASKEAKQSLTSLIKELVAEAKPDNFRNAAMTTDETNWYGAGYNHALEKFEHNLLKALEEVCPIT